MTKNKAAYPPLPEKRCFTIGEAARLALTRPHVVRYWEKHIPPLARALERRNGRRYYSADGVALLRKINSLVNDSGHTINGVAAALAGDGAAAGKKKHAFLRREIERIMAIL